jgi:hypothetical protein
VQGTHRCLQICVLCIVAFLSLVAAAVPRPRINQGRVSLPSPVASELRSEFFRKRSVALSDIFVMLFVHGLVAQLDSEVRSLAAMDLEYIITRNRNRTRPPTWSSGVLALRRFVREETLAFHQMLGLVVGWVVDTLDDLFQYRLFLSMVRFCVDRCST